MQELVAEHEPDAVALEESFVGADARIALSVGQARGAVLVAAASAGVDCAEYAPARVKQAVCGYGRAEKGQMQRMVRIILSLDAEPPLVPRGRCARRRDLPCARAAAPRGRRRMISRLRGRPAGRDADGLVLDVGGVGYLVAATPSALAARPRAPARSSSRRICTFARTRSSSTASPTPPSASCSCTCSA